MPAEKDAPFSAMSRSYRHRCLITGAGKVLCKGDNAHGQLGDGTKTKRAELVEVEGLAGAVQVEVGGHFTCALDAQGRVHCWGGNDDGQLGALSKASADRPRRVEGLPEAGTIAVGWAHACAITKRDRALWCWGRFLDEPQAPHDIGVKGVVHAVGTPLSSDSRIGTCASVGEERKTLCWGHRLDGPAEVARLEGIAAHAIAVLRTEVCVLDGAGVVTCTDVVYPKQRSSTDPDPLRRYAELPPFEQLVASETHVCARTSAGAVHCWGGCEGVFASCGKMSGGPEQVPIPEASVVSAGNYRSFAILRDGTAVEWSHVTGEDRSKVWKVDPASLRYLMRSPPPPSASP